MNIFYKYTVRILKRQLKDCESRQLFHIKGQLILNISIIQLNYHYKNLD